MSYATLAELHTAIARAGSDVASDDHREGVASFLERREAKFTGR